MKHTFFIKWIVLFVLSTTPCSLLHAQTQAKAKKQTVRYDTIIIKHVTQPAKKPVAKTEIVMPTPEYINQPYYYDADGNKLIRLENAAAVLNTKKRTLGLKGARQSLSMADPSSRTRFIAKKDITFFMKTSGDVIDLTSYIKLYRFVPAEERREVTISTKEGVLNDKEAGKGTQVSFSVKMISRDNYQLLLPDQLEAGEYGFVWMKNMELKEFTVFAFGVDWKASD